MVRNQGRVTRFVVMAVLQAARAQTLGLPGDSARSWGLNRAIFYAAAKRGFQGNTPTGPDPAAKAAPDQGPELFRLGDEEAHRTAGAPHPMFTIGGQEQTRADFERQVAARFGTAENFQQAWKEALDIVGGFDRRTLESRRGFFDEVYRPRRDELSDEWSRKYSPAPGKAPRRP